MLFYSLDLHRFFIVVFHVVIPDSVTEIGNWAFSGCSGLTSIVMPNYVSKIGNSAFWGCIGLTSIVIPDSVKSIGNYAFYGCSGLKKIMIPKSTKVGDSAFKGCWDVEIIRK